MKHTTNFFIFLVLFIASVMFLTMPVSAWSDDFNDQEVISDWTINQGTWSVINTTSIDGATDYYLYNSLTEAEYSSTDEWNSITKSISLDSINFIKFDFKSQKAVGSAGDTTYTDFDLGIGAHLRLTSADTLIGTGFTYTPQSVTENTWYHVEVTTSGTNIKVELFDITGTLLNSQTSTYTRTITDELIIYQWSKDTQVASQHPMTTIIRFDNVYTANIADTVGNGIEWDLDQYTEGETASYSWNLQNSFWQGLIYKYQIQILKDGSEIDTVKVSQTGTRFQDVNTAGTYEIKLQYSGLWPTNWQTIDSDSVNVIPKADSYINVPQTAEQKTNFTVNYLYGTTPPTAAILVKKLNEQLEAYVLYDIVYLDGGTSNTVYSQNMSIWGEGFYKLVLYNANVPEADFKTDVIQITTVIIPPQTRINTSRIRSQLDTYSISDMVWGDYTVDFTNYTSYVINLELYNYEYDAVVYSETVNDQCGVILIPLYDPDLTIFTGEHNVRLSSYSNTGVFVDDVVHDNFTINLVNPSGYGLTLSKYEVYSDETFVIKCIVPQPSTLKIINRLTLDEIDEFEVNASSYINYQISEIGNYEIRLIGASGYVEGNQYIKIVEGTIIDDPVDDDEPDVIFDTKFESMLSSGAFIALLIIIACVGAFGKIGGVVGVFLGMVVGISISFLMGYLPAWILFIMVLALCVVFVSKLINSFGGGE